MNTKEKGLFSTKNESKKLTMQIICLFFVWIIIFCIPFNHYLTNNFNLKKVFADEGITNPVFESEEKLTTSVIIAKINIDCSIYAQPNIDSTEEQIYENDIVLILESQIEGYENISYVLLEKQGNHIFGYISNTKYDIIENTQTQTSFKTFFSGVKVYRLPTTKSKVISTLENNQTLQVNGKVLDYTDHQNNQFYEIDFTTFVGYVLKNDLILSNYQDISPLEIEPTNINQTPLIAYGAIIFLLFALTIYICVLILKKTPLNKK